MRHGFVDIFLTISKCLFSLPVAYIGVDYAATAYLIDFLILYMGLPLLHNTYTLSTVMQRGKSLIARQKYDTALLVMFGWYRASGYNVKIGQYGVYGSHYAYDSLTSDLLWERLVSS